MIDRYVEKLTEYINVADYVCRKVRKKLKDSFYSLKKVFFSHFGLIIFFNVE